MKEKTFQKHKLVIDEYFVNGFNGVKAYQKFYPDASYEAADGAFRKVLENTRTSDYLNTKHKEAQTALRTSHAELLREIENWAYSDITETLTLNLDQIKELPPQVRRLITSYKKSETRFGNDNENVKTVIELKFVSKEKAMEMIHKHTGFYGEHNFQKTPHKYSREERRAKIRELTDKADASIN